MDGSAAVAAVEGFGCELDFSLAGIVEAIVVTFLEGEAEETAGRTSPLASLDCSVPSIVRSVL